MRPRGSWATASATCSRERANASTCGRGHRAAPGWKWRLIHASMFNGEGINHSKLYKLYAPGESVPGDIAGLSAAFNRIDLRVDVAGYGSGKLSIVLAH